MKILLDITDTDQQIERNILKAIAEEFNIRMVNKLPNIKNRIANLSIQIIQSTPTYASLVGGDLAGHFGLPIAHKVTMVNNILDTIKNNIDITYKNVRVSGIRFLNGLSIGVLLKNFTDILNMSEAIVTTEKGVNLLWLEWLLTAGDRIIISEHSINFSAGMGRSGMAIMVNNSAGIWRVPPQHAGTINNNWLTRAFKDNQNFYLTEISKILENELQ